MQPLYLPVVGPDGLADGVATDTRFAILHRPAGAPRSLVVYAHPLGEEMNKSRRMVAMQARALAAAGHAVLLPDLLGCGDSPGDFGDASWDGWVDEISTAARWLRDAAAGWTADAGATPTPPSTPSTPATPATPAVPAAPPLVLWGLRAGALLAVAAAARLGTVRQLLLWQPPPSGRTLLQQFLRLQAAAQLLGRDGDAAGADALRTRLAAGDTVEVAGYRLAPALAQGLEQARLTPVTGVQRLHWMELSLREPAALSPAAGPVIAAWQQAGCEVLPQVVAGPPFWQTTEIEDAPALIAATLAALDRPWAHAGAHPAPAAPVPA